MTIDYRAAVLHAVGAPMTVEPVVASALDRNNVLVRIKAVGLCHTDLEVITGSLRYPMPIVLGHEAAGIVEALGPEASGLGVGDHVVLSWNPHCGHCFYCDRNLPILCESYLAHGPKALAFDGTSRARLADGRALKQLMFLGAFAEYAIVADHQAIVVPKALPFDRACLIGCGVMTGVGAALNVATIGYGDTVMVIGVGAVGLAAVQGARLAGAGQIIAVDLDPRKLALAERVGATCLVDAHREDPAAVARAKTARRRCRARSCRQPPIVPRQRRGGASGRRGDLARQDRCRRRNCVPLGQPDGRQAHPAVELWRGAAGTRFSTPCPRLSRRQAHARRTDLAPYRTRRDQRRLRRLAARRDDPQRRDVVGDGAYPCTASSPAAIVSSPQNARRNRRSGKRRAAVTPAEIAAVPPIASGTPSPQSTRPAPA